MAISDNAREEIRNLRDQVNQLMDDRVSPAFSDASKRAGQAATRARSEEHTSELQSH